MHLIFAKATTALSLKLYFHVFLFTFIFFILWIVRYMASTNFGNTSLIISNNWHINFSDNIKTKYWKLNKTFTLVLLYLPSFFKKQNPLYAITFITVKLRNWITLADILGKTHQKTQMLLNVWPEEGCTFHFMIYLTVPDIKLFIMTYTKMEKYVKSLS